MDSSSALRFHAMGLMNESIVLFRDKLGIVNAVSLFRMLKTTHEVNVLNA